VNSLYDYIIEPIGERYNNKKKIGNKELILNTKIENFKAVNKLAKVVSIPKAYKLPIEVGDIVHVHHNVFRRFYDMKGRQKNSRSYFKEDLYFCSPDQIYLYNRDKENNCFLDRCFVRPIKSEKLGQKFIPNKGVLEYDNNYLNSLGIFKKDIVIFKNSREWEFNIDGDLLYCMKSKDILIKYEDKRNEEEYNKSWSNSSERTDKSSTGAYCGHRGGCVCGPSEERSCH